MHIVGQSQVNNRQTIAGPAIGRRFLAQVTLVFVLAMGLGAYAVDIAHQHRIESQRTRFQQIADIHLRVLSQTLHQALSATYALAALVRQGGGEVRDFENVGRQLLQLSPGISAVQLAPDGVVMQSFPLTGNEKAIGHNLLADPNRTREAFLARDTGKLTLAGPFALIQGGTAVAGRLPVFLDGPDKTPHFWGFTTVLMDIQTLLAAADLQTLDDHGLQFVLAKNRLDSTEPQILHASSAKPLLQPVSASLAVPNGEWTLAVAPTLGWGDQDELYRNALAALVVSMLFTALTAMILYQPILLRREVAQRTQALAESEAHFSRFFHENASIMLRIDADLARITDANLAAHDFYRYPSNVLVGMAIHDLCAHGLEKSNWQSPVNASAAYQGGIFTQRLGSGELRSVEVHPTIITGEQGNELYWIIHDVSARTHAEERLELALEASNLGIWELNLNSMRLIHCVRMSRMLGYAPEDLPTDMEDWKSITHPEDWQALLDAQSACQSGNYLDYRLIIRLRDKQGEWRFIERRGRLARDAEGKPSRLVGTHRDVSERVRQEALLKEETRLGKEAIAISFDPIVASAPFNEATKIIVERLASALDSSRAGIWLYDPGNRTFRCAATRPVCDKSACDGLVKDKSLCPFYFSALKQHGVAAIHEQFAGDDMAALLDTHVGLAENATGLYAAIMYEGAIVGIIGTESDDQQRAWPPAEKAFLLALSNLCSGLYAASLREKDLERLHLAAAVFTHAREGITITDTNGRIVDVNDAFVRITGYARDEVLGQNPRILQSGRHPREFYKDLWRDLVSKGHWHGEIWNRRKDGEVYAELLTISAVRGKSGRIQHYVGMFSDITALKDHERELEHIAHFDALTGLPNRVLLSDRLHQSLSQTERRKQILAVVFMDLDGFKAINDAHGHQVGDQLLVTVSMRLKNALRDGDTIARLGGDEFVAVLCDLNSMESCAPMLARLLDAASQPVQIQNTTLGVSASIGVTFYPQAEYIDSDQLLRQADQAMYQAKLAGKNRYHIFDPEQDRNVRGHHQILDRAREALSKQEFVLYYQPKVNLGSGAIVGAEALLRWRHPEHGILSPGAFMPLIDESDLSVEVGEWVIQNALSQIARWRQDGLPLPISVNISARHMQRRDFMSRLLEMLSRHPKEVARDLELEVLETSALDDMNHVAALIDHCQEIGVRVALDDFGTGYSSLAYLKRLPASELKIDQSFVRGMLDDPEDMAIIEGVLGLATAFRRSVVAEGVETEEHGRVLLQLGCEVAQGYGIAYPMPAAEIPAWAQNWRPFPKWLGVRPLPREEIPVLFAMVEHRAWIKQVTDYLRGFRPVPPILNECECRCGLWLNESGTISKLGFARIAALHEAHHAIHVLAQELVSLHTTGSTAQALSRIGQLENVMGNLLNKLDVALTPTKQTATGHGEQGDSIGMPGHLADQIGAQTT